MGDPGAGGELSLVLLQLRSVEEQIAGIHDAHKRLESKLESRLLEVIGHMKRGAAAAPPPGGVDEALRQLQGCLRRLEAAAGAAAPQRAGDGEESQRRHTAHSVATLGSQERQQQALEGVPHPLSHQSSFDAEGEAADNAPQFRMAASKHFTKRSTSSVTVDNVVSVHTQHPRDTSDVDDVLQVTTARRQRSTGTRLSSRLLISSRSVLPSVKTEPHWMILHPNSLLVRVYDLVIFTCLLCQIFVVPYQLAFCITMYDSLFVAAVTYAAVTCWSVDLFAGFVIGRYNKGELVMDLGTIGKHYLRKEFILNFVTLVLDIASIGLELLLTHRGGNMQLWNVARWIKLGRLVRICIKLLGTGRALNLSDSIVSAVRQRGNSAQVEALLEVCWAILAIVFVNHIGACFWWMIGSDSVEKYASDHGISGYYMGGRSEYFVAYYNSVSLTITGQNVFDGTSSAHELWATILGIYFGLIFVSVIISKVATHLIDFHMVNKENSDKVRLLQKFLQQRRVAAQVAIPVEKQVFERLRSVTWLAEKDVAVLSMLSPSLRAELLCNVYSSSVRRLPFVVACNSVEESFVKDICYNALLPKVLDPGKRVFEPAQEAHGAYFVSWGTCEYTAYAEASLQANSSHPNTQNFMDAEEVEPGIWVAEVALWISWHHRGCLECSKACELLRLPADSLRQILRHRSVLVKISQDYMSAVAAALAVEPDDRLTDLRMCVDHETVITSMPLDSRRHLSNAAHAMLGSSAGSWVRPFGIKGGKDLAAEVASGACDLVVDKEDRVKRIVNVVALSLMNEEGKLLVRIAEKHGEVIVPDLVLPGTKVRGGELPGAALRRFLESQLKDLGPFVQIARREVLIEERLSSSVGVDTKYLRTVFHGTVDSGLVATSGAAAAAAARLRPPMKGAMSMKVRSLRSTNPRFDFSAPKEEVIYLNDGVTPGHTALCAWMDPKEFTALTSSNMGQAAARSWIQSLGLYEPNPNHSLEDSICSV